MKSKIIGNYDNLDILYPPGGMGYILDNVTDIFPENTGNKICISIGSQPNSSPHFGTIITFASAFSLAAKLKEERGVDVSILFDAIDTAPGPLYNIDGIKYQKPLYLEMSNSLNNIDDIMAEYNILLDSFSLMSGVNYTVRRLTNFSKTKEFRDVLLKVLEKKEIFTDIINPSGDKGLLRAPCKHCGLTDKHGKVTKIEKINEEFILKSSCPEHGCFEINLNNEYYLAQMNSSLRNIIRGAIYHNDNKSGKVFWGRVTGGDWSGSFQEKIYLRGLYELGCDFSYIPTTIYSPVITDWSGAKLSKSMYLKHGAYQDLGEEFINLRKLIDKCGEKEIEKIWYIVNDWMDDPLKFFRNYSIYAVIKLLKEKENL